MDLEGKCVTEIFFTERKSPPGSLVFTVKVCLFVFFTVEKSGLRREKFVTKFFLTEKNFLPGSW